MNSWTPPGAADTAASRRRPTLGAGERPLVSVVLIFLNAERFIDEAIRSVVGQTYDRWELLLVDDGSTDQSTHIAKSYAREDPHRVRYLEHDGHQNRRMSPSRNLGIRHARGKYIALIDADDVWLPNKLERQVALLESNPEAGMLYGATLYWRSWDPGRPAGADDYVPALGVRASTLYQPPILLTLQLAGTACSPCPSDVLLRHEVVKAVGGFDETVPDMFEDQAFFAKIKLHTPVYVADECWDKYRLHPDSHCAVETNAGRAPLNHRRYLHWLDGYLTANGIRDGEVWRAFREQQWPLRHPVLAQLSAIRKQFLTHPARALKGLLRLALPPTLRRHLRRAWPRGQRDPELTSRP